MTTYRDADGTANDQDGLLYPSGAVGARFDYLGRRRQGTTAAPTVAVGAGAGTSATVTAHTGTDEHGNVQIHCGASGVGAGVLATVTFAQAYTGNNPPIVQIEPKDLGAAALYYASCSNTVLTINLVNAPTISTTYSFDYYVTGGA
jgi:hypothetical protein